MSTEENKAIARRYPEEVYNEKNLDVLDEIIDKNIVAHWGVEMEGLQTIKEYVSMNQNAFPDVKLTIKDQIAEGDKVVNRWTFTGTHKGEFKGIAPTGKSVTVTGIIIFKIANGKIVESWSNIDMLGLMQQIGAVPPPKQNKDICFRILYKLDYKIDNSWCWNIFNIMIY